jgi:hypothetical protein
MEIKKVILVLAIIVAIIVPWYIKYMPYLFTKKRCNKDIALIKMNENLNKLNICNNEEFELLIKILSNHMPDLQFINLLSKNEQYAIYEKLLNNYVIDAYAVTEYLHKEKIDQKEDFIKDKELYLKIMENNFNMGVFQKHIANTIVIDDVYAEKYYNENKETLFAQAPFVKVAPGIQANIVIMDNDKKTNKEYEKILLDKKQCIPIENYNPKIMKIEDSNLASALLEMKNKEYKIVTLKNNQKIMIYKIAEAIGEWYDFIDVKDKIKSALKKKTIEEEALKNIAEIKNKLEISVAKKNLEDYIDEKSQIYNNQLSLFDPAESKNSITDIDSDVSSEEFIEEKDVKEVEQEIAQQ